jgi:hypothetical protein
MQNRTRRAAVPAMPPKMIAAIVPPEIDLVATFPEGPESLPLTVWVGSVDGLVNEGVDSRGFAESVAVVIPVIVVGFWRESEDVVLVVDETLDEDEVTEVVDEKDEEDGVDSLNSGVLEGVVRTTGVELEVGVGDVDEVVWIGGDFDVDVGVGVAGVVVPERQKMANKRRVPWTLASQFAHQLQRHWDLQYQQALLAHATSGVAAVVADGPS